MSAIGNVGLKANWIIARLPGNRRYQNSRPDSEEAYRWSRAEKFARASRKVPVPRLSIVIPCVGGAAEFDGTLVSVLQHRPSDCEVLVIHSLPYDDPYALQGEVRFVRVSGRPNLVELINTGVEAAKGEVVHIVACGLDVTEGWTDGPMARFQEDSSLAAVSPVIVAADKFTVEAAGIAWTWGGSRRILRGPSAAKVGSRGQQHVFGPTLFAGFFRREELWALGGFDERMGHELADVGLALTMRELGLPCMVEPGSQLVLNSLAGIAKPTKSLRQAHLAERLFWRHAVTAGFVRAVLTHAFMVSSEVLGELPRMTSALMLLGRLLAVLEIGSVKRYAVHLAELRNRIEDLHQANPPTLSFSTARNTASPVEDRSLNARTEKRQAA